MNTEGSKAEIQSPCVRNCCLDGNDICLGCFRSLNEILSWSDSNQDQKKQIVLNCKKRRISIEGRGRDV